MRCPSCDSENPDVTKFCGNCGQPLRNRCAKCGSENPPQFKFCGECGAALAGKLQAVSAKAAAIKPASPAIRVAPEAPAGAPLDGELCPIRRKMR